jgi:CubicO group peptidase (beta-lactamase class C family)
MSKCFAAVALLMLRDNGLVSLDATVQQAVPTLKLTEPFLSATLHDLIAMRLDLPVDDPWADRQMGGVR